MLGAKIKKKKKKSAHKFRLELKRGKFDLQNEHVVCLPACLPFTV